MTKEMNKAKAAFLAASCAVFVFSLAVLEHRRRQQSAPLDRSGHLSWNADEQFATLGNFDELIAKMTREGAYLEPTDAKETAIRRAWPVGGFVNLRSPAPWCLPWVDPKIDHGKYAEIILAPGYIEQDDKTVTMRIGNKVIVPEWYDTVGWNNGKPLTQEELLRRWQARDGTVFKVVPKGEFPK